MLTVHSLQGRQGAEQQGRLCSAWAWTENESLPCRANDELDGEASDDEGGAQARSKSTMYVKWSKELHGERKAGQKEPLNTTFLKKYFTVVKRRGK